MRPVPRTLVAWVKCMIRRVTLPGVGFQSSCIGFGCASLGSRISPRQGLQALERAYDTGVTWYDVAPAYGAGEAEGLIGQFIAGKRDKVIVCTKVGLAPPNRNSLMKAIYTVARPAAAMAKGLRKAFRKMPSTRNQKMELTAELIETSMARSLTRLKSDYVDVFALHDPDPAEVTRHEVLMALEKLVTSGKARSLSVAGKAPACLAGAPLLPYGIFQTADDPADNVLERLRAAAGRPIGTVTHSVLGIDGMRDRFIEKILVHAGAQKRMARAGYEGAVEKMAAELLLDRAFASNPDGVVLMSMFAERHLAANVLRASLDTKPETLSLVRDILSPSL